jgi:hypothetical protein
MKTLLTSTEFGGSHCDAIVAGVLTKLDGGADPATPW